MYLIRVLRRGNGIDSWAGDALRRGYAAVMASAIVAIGDELVGGFTLDTNSHWLAGRLRRLGRPVKRVTAVRDVVDEIVAELRRAIDDPEVSDVFTSGGLGPTPDDRTAEAVAALLGRPLVAHPEIAARMERRTALLRELGVVDDESTLAGRARMAVLPEAPDRLLMNRHGTVPGLLYVVDGGTRLFVLPGVPSELRVIVGDAVEPLLAADGDVRAPVLREVRLAGTMESQLAPIMVELEGSHPDVSVGSYPGADTILVRFSGDDAARVEDAARVATAAMTRLGATRLA
jgi:nicotinamide-nucleotide amidase